MKNISGYHQVKIPADATEVWRAMRRYEDLSWAQGIDEVRIEGEGVGMVRKVRLSGATDWIRERLVSRDDESMRFSYAIEGDGMPGFSNYQALAWAEAVDGACILHWECRASVADDAAEAGETGLQALAQAISTLFADQFSSE